MAVILFLSFMLGWNPKKLKEADIACTIIDYEAKEQGFSGKIFFEKELNIASKTTMHLQRKQVTLTENKTSQEQL